MTLPGKIRIFLVVLCILALPGCQAGSVLPGNTAQPVATVPPEIPPTGIEQTLVAPEETLTPSLQNLVSQAKQKLSQKFQLNIADISLFSVAPAEWPDSSLGCPQPGVLYQPVVTPGYQMVFESGRRTFVVHTGQSSQVLICTVRAPDEVFPTP